MRAAGATGTGEWRPVRLRRVCFGAAAVVLIVVTVVAATLPVGGPAGFGRADQVAMFVLGVVIAAVVLLFTRPRLRVDAGGLHVRNIVGSHHVPWRAVVAVRYDVGAPWACLELAHDELLALHALQSADRARTYGAVLELRHRLAAAAD